MQIVDAQIHLWGTGLPSNLSHRQVTHFTPEEAIVLMDEGGVDAAVIHPPGWDPASTDMALAAVQNYPGRFAIMGLGTTRPTSVPRAHRDLARAIGNARTALYVPARSGSAMAARWHDRLALGGCGRCRRELLFLGSPIVAQLAVDRSAHEVPDEAGPDFSPRPASKSSIVTLSAPLAPLIGENTLPRKFQVLA